VFKLFTIQIIFVIMAKEHNYAKVSNFLRDTGINTKNGFCSTVDIIAEQIDMNRNAVYRGLKRAKNHDLTLEVGWYPTKLPANYSLGTWAGLWTYNDFKLNPSGLLEKFIDARASFAGENNERVVFETNPLDCYERLQNSVNGNYEIQIRDVNKEIEEADVSLGELKFFIPELIKTSGFTERSTEAALKAIENATIEMPDVLSEKNKMEKSIEYAKGFDKETRERIVGLDIDGVSEMWKVWKG